MRAVTLPGAADGVAFMLTVNPEDFNRDTLVGALGQAFFSLSVGMGIMVTYGSYVPKKENLVKSAAWICFLDTMVAILSAFAIIPVVFVTLGAEGLGMGGGFAFMALPEVFAGFPGGVLFGLAFLHPSVSGRSHQCHQHSGKLLRFYHRRVEGLQAEGCRGLTLQTDCRCCP